MSTLDAFTCNSYGALKLIRYIDVGSLLPTPDRIMIVRSDDTYGCIGAFYTIPSASFGDIKCVISPPHRRVQELTRRYRRNAEACRNRDACLGLCAVLRRQAAQGRYPDRRDMVPPGHLGREGDAEQGIHGRQCREIAFRADAERLAADRRNGRGIEGTVAVVARPS